MKQFEYKVTITIATDGYDTVEAKNQASAQKKIDVKIQDFIKNNNLENIALSFNSDLVIDSEVTDISTSNVTGTAFK